MLLNHLRLNTITHQVIILKNWLKVYEQLVPDVTVISCTLATMLLVPWHVQIKREKKSLWHDTFDMNPTNTLSGLIESDCFCFLFPVSCFSFYYGSWSQSTSIKIPACVVVNYLHLCLAVSPSMYLYPTVPLCLCQIICILVISDCSILPPLE